MQPEKLLLNLYGNAQIRQFTFEEKKVEGFALSDINIYYKPKIIKMA